MYNKKLILYLFLFFNFTRIISTNSGNFIIENKQVSLSKVDTRKLSRNRLKEDIGDSLKNVLHNCAKLNKLVGKIQIELSGIQKNLFSKVEALVENKAPFKNANKLDLADASNIMKKTKLQLETEVKNIQNLREQINKNNCLKNAKLKNKTT
ncbi:hypothetical protein K9L05_02060 [Candidatus Babeliales bacterium]|nr:hypothetical protein [Candidatus Babeliales bacterium]MCF7899413.1 hypothetical protein [Candidatus Babeliales bacterium]